MRHVRLPHALGARVCVVQTHKFEAAGLPRTAAEELAMYITELIVLTKVRMVGALYMPAPSG